MSRPAPLRRTDDQLYSLKNDATPQDRFPVAMPQATGSLRSHRGPSRPTRAMSLTVGAARPGAGTPSVSEPPATAYVNGQDLVIVVSSSGTVAALYALPLFLSPFCRAGPAAR